MEFGVGSQRRSAQKAVETVVSRGSARGAGSQPGETSTRPRIQQVPEPHMIDSQFGLRNLRVIRSDSPIASYFAWSKFGSAGCPAGALRRVGGNVQTPKGWSLVNRSSFAGGHFV